MRTLELLQWAILLSSNTFAVSAASSWGFNDATVSVQGKGTGVGGGYKEKLSQHRSLPKEVQFHDSDTLKIILTAQEGKTAKRPHQAFLMLEDPTTGLETSYAFSIKDSGKGKIELTHKDIPNQLIVASNPLSASIAVASFGSSTPYISKAFDLSLVRDAGIPFAPPEKPLRYGKRQEIHHTFKADPKSPPIIITLLFTAVVLIALPSLLVTWASLGANINHLSNAMSNSPLSHGLFFTSILAMEGIFYMYYRSWNLFQTLPAAIGIGCVAFLSGSRALSEVQERRLSGLR